MPQTTAWAVPEIGPASLMPAQGNKLSLLLSVARACGREDTCHFHICQCHLPPHRCLKSWWILQSERQRGFSFSASSHPLWTRSSSLGQRLYLSQGLPWQTSIHHTHTLAYCCHAPSLLSLSFPLPLSKPHSSGFQQSLSQHYVHGATEAQACLCEALTMV